LAQLPAPPWPVGATGIEKLEAPLAVQGRPPRSGFFPMNKFSSVPLVIRATRQAWSESGGDDVRDFSLVHAACLAMIERSALVTTAFTVRGKQILHTRPEYERLVDNEDGTPPSIGQLVIAGNEVPDEDETEYWRQWPSRFDYLYVLFTDDDAPNPDSDMLTLLFEGDRFQLYGIKPR